MQKIIILTLALFLSSCITQALWSDKFYEDEIKKFYVDVKGKSIALIGENFHYVLNDKTSLLQEVLSLKQRSVLSFNRNNSSLKLSGKNNLKGIIAFSGPYSQLHLDDKKKLKSFGFKPDENDNIVVKVKLSGKRYASKYTSNNSEPNGNLDQSIRIYYDDSGIITDTAKLAITPITVGLDAVVLIGKVVIIPFRAN